MADPRQPGPHDPPGPLPGPNDPPPEIPDHLKPGRFWPSALRASNMYPGMLSWHPVETCSHSIHGAVTA